MSKLAHLYEIWYFMILLFFQEKSKSKMMQIKNYKRIKGYIED